MTKRWPQGLDLARKLVDYGLILAALGILLALALRAAVSIDGSHDTWWYHLPWAARLAGLMPADGYTFDAATEARYAGFPVLMHWIQGQLWSLAGRAESANFLALGSLAVFALFLRLRFKVPLQLTLLALLAVPLIQIHSTAAYVDLPANLALTAAILMLLPLYSRDAPLTPGDVTICILACAVTAHSKLQLTPVVALVLAGGIGALVLRWLRLPSRPPLSGGRVLAASLAVALIAAAVLAVPLRNLVLYGNPAYPFALKIGPWTLNGPEGIQERHDALLRDLMAARSPGPATAPAAPAQSQAPPAERSLPMGTDPLAWAYSVLEIGMEPLSGRGQWSIAGGQRPPLPERYGGFFGWYVVYNLILLAALVARRRTERAEILTLFLAASLVASLMPAQVFLRYYMFWMILLVSLNLILLRPAGPAGATGTLGDGQRALGLVALGAFLLAVYATGADYVRPRFYFLEDLIAHRRDPQILAQVAGHPSSCLVGEQAPRVFLYAPLFNPGTQYRLKMGPVAGERPERVAQACGPGWTPVVAERPDAGLLPPRHPHSP